MNVNKLEYENDVMQLYCHEVYRYVFVRFRNNLSPFQYVTWVQNVMEVLKEKKMNYLIVDLSQWSNSAEVSRKWKEDVLLLHLTEYELRKCAIVGNNDEQVNTVIHQQKDSISQWQIKFRHCSSYEEAENWILRVE